MSHGRVGGKQLWLGSRYLCRPHHVSQPRATSESARCRASRPRLQALLTTRVHHVCSHTRIKQACVGARGTECWLGRLVVAIRPILLLATQLLRAGWLYVPGRCEGVPADTVADLIAAATAIHNGG